jgi:hypothetical protein
MRLNIYVVSTGYQKNYKIFYFLRDIKLCRFSAFVCSNRNITKHFIVWNFPSYTKIHQNTFSKVPPFVGQLHCRSPLHSATHGNNQTMTELNSLSKVLQPLWILRCSLVSVAPPLHDTPQLRKAQHAPTELFVII